MVKQQVKKAYSAKRKANEDILTFKILNVEKFPSKRY
jgi:hypothetical protein